MLGSFLSSNSRAEILRILFDGQSQERYLRELEKLTDIGLHSLQKELKHLVSLSLVNERKDGNRIYYKANKQHPIYVELLSIVEKTVGLGPILKIRLSVPEINYAFIFGSVTKGNVTSASDIDLIIIGSIRMRSLSKLLSGMQEKIGREINPHIFTEDEFKKRLTEKDHFLTSVLKDKIQFLIGDSNDFRESFSKRSHR